jgi:hypothetical protein
MPINDCQQTSVHKPLFIFKICLKSALTSASSIDTIFREVNSMSDPFLTAGAVCFAVFAILAVYAALRGNNVLLGGMLVCLAVSGGVSVYAIRLQSIGVVEPEQKFFVAVDINGLNDGPVEPEPDDTNDDARSPDNNVSFGLMLAVLNTASSVSPSSPRSEFSATQAGSDSPDGGASIGSDVGTVIHTEDSSASGAASSVPITKYVASDLSETSGFSAIEWEDRLRREHLSVIEKRYSEFLESQRQSGAGSQTSAAAVTIGGETGDAGGGSGKTGGYVEDGNAETDDTGGEYVENGNAE